MKAHRFKMVMSAYRRIIAPATLLSMLAAILALTIFSNNRMIDIHRHDTYYVLTLGWLQAPFALLFGTEALIYFLLRRRRMNRWMPAVHVAGCWCLAAILFWLPDVLPGPALNNAPRRYYDYSPGVLSFIRQYFMSAILGLFFALGQVLFIWQVLLLLLRKSARGAVSAGMRR